MPRLLACYGCTTLIKLPDYDGEPQWDMALIDATQRHAHRDLPEEKQRGQLFTVDQATYDVMDVETILKNTYKETHQWFYDVRDELNEDAMKCWLKHGSPGVGDGCSDFETDAKAIGRVQNVPKTKRRYLCQHCPFTHGVVVPELRWKKGMYD